MLGLNLLGYLLLIVGVAHSLHYQQSSSQLIGYDMKAQLQRLQAQQAAFEAAVDRISQNLDSITNRINKANDTEKVLLLENAISRQRQEIYSISTMILPPFNLSKCSCENLTDKEKVLMLSDLEGVRKNIKNVQETLRKVPRCDKIDAMNRDIEKQLFFVQSMEDILYAKCLKVIILSPTIFQTNLYVDNWVLGDQTADEVVDQYYQRSLRYNNVTNCPLSRPFFVGTECIACPQEFPVFNLLQRRCISCGPGGSVDTVTRKCVMKGPTLKTNYDAPNYSLEGLARIPPAPPTATQTCPISTPFFNGVKCIACALPSYFSVLNGFCKNCPNGQIFDALQKKCVEPVPIPVPVPVPVAVTPVAIAVGKFSTNFEATNFKVPANKTLDEFKFEEAQRRKNDPTIQICPLQTPYSNGQKCFTCSRAPFIYFNLQTKKCAACPAGSTYDSEKMGCFTTQQITTVETIPITTTKIVTGQQFLSNLENNFWITNDGNVTKVFDYNRNQRSKNPGLKICPIEAPFFNGEKCISCPAYFNFDSKQCEGCKQGTSFNPNLHICEVSSASSDANAAFQTNPMTAQNLIYDGISSQQYKHAYEANIANNPSIKDCDIPNPYWNGKQCISCPPGTPYFNLDAKVCQNCSVGSRYNAQNRECEDQQGKYINQGPTIQKLIAGII